MKPEAFNDPLYVPKNGAEWETWVWYSLEATPNQTTRKLTECHPHLSLGAASGFLSKLMKRKQVAAVKFTDVETKREVFHYSIACPEYVPAERRRNKRVTPPLPPFNFDHVNKPIQLIEDAVHGRETERANLNSFSAEEFTKPLTLAHCREVYDYLHGIFGPRT